MAGIYRDAGMTTSTENCCCWRRDTAGGRSQGVRRRRRARSDWMAVERDRGVSVSSALMSFEHEGLAFNLWTWCPEHRAATCKLFEICRLRARPLRPRRVRPADDNDPKIIMILKLPASSVIFSEFSWTTGW